MQDNYTKMLMQAMMEQNADTVRPEQREEDEMTMKPTPDPMEEMMQLLMMMNQGQ